MSVYPRLNTSLTYEEAEWIIRSFAEKRVDFHYTWDIEDTTRKEIESIISDLLWGDEIPNIFYYLTARIRNIAQALGLVHEALGGSQESNDRLMQLTKDALKHYLSSGGWANQLTEEQWILTQYPLEIYGEGKNWVYLYYYQSEAEQARAEAKKDPERPRETIRWDCNIGRTAEREPEKRIIAQVENPGDLIIGYLFREDNHRELEKAIHAILKLHNANIQRNGEREWFFLDPWEVKGVYDKIMDFP